MRGPSKLIWSARKQRYPIAVLYSKVNYFAGMISNSETLPDTALGDWFWALADLGLGAQCVTPEDVRSGELEKRKMKVLILPYIQAISDETAKAIKNFVPFA